MSEIVTEMHFSANNTTGFRFHVSSYRILFPCSSATLSQKACCFKQVVALKRWNTIRCNFYVGLQAWFFISVDDISRTWKQ